MFKFVYMSRHFRFLEEIPVDDLKGNGLGIV